MPMPTQAEKTARVAEIFSNAALLVGGKPDKEGLAAELARRLLDNGVLSDNAVEEKAIHFGTLLDDVFPDLVRPGDKGYDDLEAAAYKIVTQRVNRALEILKDGSGPVQALINAENSKNGHSQQGIMLLKRQVKTTGRYATSAYYVSDDPECIETDWLDGMRDRQRKAQENAALATNFCGDVQPANAQRFSTNTTQALDESVKTAKGLLNA